MVFGIDKGSGEFIFDRYFSEDESGIGFGLYFVKEVLEKYFQGSIRYESKFGHWTKFYIEIPL